MVSDHRAERKAHLSDQRNTGERLRDGVCGRVVELGVGVGGQHIRINLCRHAVSVCPNRKRTSIDMRAGVRQGDVAVEVAELIHDFRFHIGQLGAFVGDMGGNGEDAATSRHHSRSHLRVSNGNDAGFCVIHNQRLGQRDPVVFQCERISGRSRADNLIRQIIRHIEHTERNSFGGDAAWN